MTKEKFIVIEGCSGSGKSTLHVLMKNYFEEKGFVVFSTKEPPNHTPEKENNKKGYELFDIILEDRRWHVNTKILPALNEGKIVICDRYVPSCLVYQYLDGVSKEHIWETHRDFPIPELTIYLESPPEIIADRINQRETKTRYELDDFRKNEINEYNKVFDFLKLQNWNILKLDSNKNSPEQLLEIVINKLNSSKN
jgi:dTMP kinase